MAKQSTEHTEHGHEPRRPSIEEQLEMAKAGRGTAFEKFIRLNQDFELLRPGETTHDIVGLPLWLRVYWRKQHPHESHSASPLGDYPESLNRILEWMQLNQELLPDPEKWLHASERKPKGGKRGT